MQLSSCLLESDFTDYYDECFSTEGENPHATRFMRQKDMAGGLGDQINILRLAGFLVPDILNVQDVPLPFSPRPPGMQQPRFLSLGETAPLWVAPNGKAQVPHGALLDLYGIPPKNFSERYRYIQVGIRHFWFKACNTPPWPALAPAHTFQLLHWREPVPANQLRHFRVPVFSIDFMMAANNSNLLAVGLDLSPRLKDMGVDKWLEAEEAASSILATLACSTGLESDEPAHSV
ncbi:hypothetical protein [Alteromonas sp. 14N.309.X.WAT.G.H12]|uniref:hypothetical protein n=1 Tax=Alteromonas sp. 14N.309.X.WAT.G.H12 TaxID=3120824 RepID=UPI002FCF8269